MTEHCRKCRVRLEENDIVLYEAIVFKPKTREGLQHRVRHERGRIIVYHKDCKNPKMVDQDNDE